MSLSPRRIFIRLAGRLAAPLTFGAFALFGCGDLFAQIPPDAGWRTFDTENFRVHYTRGLEELARRAGERGETAYRELSAALVAPPQGKIDLLVADNVDFANGYATPLPTNRVVIYAHPPVGEPSLAFYDDWLELVITHELAHVFHLDYAGSVYRPLRSVFGRAPFLFPSVLVPGWVIEGLATHLESELTRAGRVRGTMHDMALRTAILQDAFFSIDRATGSPVTWPGGSTRYIYGSLFIAHLAERYGEEKVGEFVRAVGGSFIPYRLNAAAERSFGISFTRAWEEWEAELRARYLPLAAALRREGLTEPEILTPAGRHASFPRFSPEGTRISYAAATGRDDPATHVIYLVSDEDRVALRRTTLGPAGWLAGGDSLLIAQLEFIDPYRIYSDLYRTSSREDKEVRITERARLSDPDPSRDGLRAAVVESTGGSNVPAILDLRSATTRRLAEPSLDVHWALPRFSPRGDRIAVTRWRSGGFYDIVILDTTGRILQELTADRAVDASPAWSPDGEYIVFSSDRTGISNLYAYDLAADSLWQVTNVLTGAFQPDVSPDARWIVFSLYAADGYHIARIPFEPETWRPAPSLRPQFIVEESADYTATAGGPDRPYSPWRSLAPAAWSPYLDGGTELGVGIGAATGGQDLVGRHAYGAYALLYPRDTRAEAAFGYRNARLGVPIFELGVDQDWSVEREDSTLIRVDSTIVALQTGILERRRSLGLGVTLPRRRVRSYTWFSVAAEWSDRAFVWSEPDAAGPLADSTPIDLPPDRAALVTLGHSTVREYDFSISPARGYFVQTTLEGHRYTRGFGPEDDPEGYLRLIARTRTYAPFPLWGFARHVLAARLSFGTQGGARAAFFRVGGASGTSSLLSEIPGLRGGSRSFSVRGYGEGAQRGNQALAGTLEYRFPLLLAERGVGVLPLFLDRIWGDFFADAGTAWCAGECELLPGALREPAPLWSVGAELGTDFTVGYHAPLRLRGGVAVPLRDIPGGSRPSPELYLGVGRSF